MGRVRIGELLVGARVIHEDQLTEALAVQRLGSRKLGQVLVDLGFVNETQLTQFLSQQLSVPWVSLYHIDFSRELLNLVPREVAERYCLVPVFVRNVRRQGNTLYVAMDDPTHDGALAAVSEAAGIPSRPMIASPTEIRAALRAYYSVPGRDPPPPPKVPAGPQTVKGPPPLPTARAKPGPLGRTLPGIAPNGIDAELRAQGVVLSEPPAKGPGAPEPKAPEASASGDSPDDEPIIEAREIVPKRRIDTRMVSLTLLDGTSINVPARPHAQEAGTEEPAGGSPTHLTARELIAALRAVTHGADASEVLGETRQWEPMFAAILSVLLRKGLVADWEFVEELRKM